MIISQYYLREYGFHLEAAAIDIEEITLRDSHTFSDPNDPAFPDKNAYMKIKIWVNQNAYDQGLKPILVEEKPLMIFSEESSQFINQVLSKVVSQNQV